MAKQKMATWGAPIRWPTPVGEAGNGDRESKTRGSGYVGNEMTECMNVSSYKDLKVWNKGIEIVDHVSDVTSL